jgi:hypothetical protein
MNKNLKTAILVFIIICSLQLFVSKIDAATYYVSGTSGNDSNAGTLDQPWKTVQKANTTLRAGDTVFIRGGSYTITGTAINPANTGTAGNIITYSSYNGEIVEFYGSGVTTTAVNLNSDYGTIRSYIKVYGLNFYNFMQHLWILKGTHNEISHCKFIGYPAGATQNHFIGSFQASYIYRQAQYNWIHDCVFGLWGYNATYGNDNGGVFGIGVESSNTDNTRYNIVENNEMYGGGHHVAYLNGSYNIFRNNYFHNEPWYPIGNPIYSTRIVAQEGYEGDGQHNLNEGNRIGYGGPKNKDEIGGNAVQAKSSYNIWRYNTFVQTYLAAMLVERYPGQALVRYNHIYNNTYWHGGYGRYQYYPSGTAPSPNWEDKYTHAILLDEGSSGADVYDNTIKNNIFYQDSSVLSSQYSILSRFYSGRWITRVPIFQNISNNWLDSTGDPKFVDISGTPNPANRTQFNFNLQSDSPAIDGGEALATANGSGSGSTTLVLNTLPSDPYPSAYFFYDAGNVASEWPTANVNNDWIAVGTVSNIARIISIDYSANKITLATPLTWSNGASVWLFKRSDGTVVLNGLAPDYGAYESNYTGGLIAPKNMRIVELH